MGSVSWTKVSIAGSLALVAAAVDVIAFVRYGSFAALQTGNMIFIGRELYQLTDDVAAEQDSDAGLQATSRVLNQMAYHFAMMFSNFLGVFGFCVIVDFSRYPVLVSAPLIGALTIASGSIDVALGGSKWAACLASASLGAMNFISSPITPLSGRLFAMTALATGNLQKCAKSFHHLVFGHKFTPADLQSTLNATTVVICSILGAIIGGLALGTSPFGEDITSAWTFIPLGAAQTLILLWHDYVLRPRPPPETAPLVQPLSNDQPAQNGPTSAFGFADATTNV